MKVDFFPKFLKISVSNVDALRKTLLGNVSLKKCLEKDVVELSHNVFTKNDLLKMTSFGVKPETFDKLTDEDFRSLITAPFGNVSTIKYVNKFSDLLKQCFDKISGEKPYKVVAIGRSLASSVEFMRFKGCDTGVCPISGLTYMDPLEVDDIVENSGKYVNYLKKFGVDFDNLSKDKNYYFIDYKNTGKSLQNFEDILTKLGVCGENIRVMGIGDAFYEAKLAKENSKFLSDFISHYLHRQNLKSDFSPIPRLDYFKLDDVEKISANYFNNKCHEPMIVALARLYDSMKNPQKYNINF